MSANAHAESAGPLEVVGLLATGGMSEIYLGRHGGQDELIVLKRLPPEKASDPALLRMFEDEIRISRLVCDHGNIVRYLEHGTLDGSQFIAFELIEGLNVAEILQRAASRGLPVPAPVVLHIAKGALDGLAHAHAAKDEHGQPLDLIHRDVSPTNIVVTWSGEVKLLDFGVSKSEGRTLVTAPGLVKGKPYFMAPEQLRTEPIDHRVDLYALGVVLYFLLTQRHPFEGHEGVNVFDAMLEGKVTPPDQIVPGLSPALCEVILRALRLDRDDRFSSAAEMKAALLDAGDEVAGHEDMMMFLSDVAEEDLGRRGAKLPEGIGGAGWQPHGPADEAGHAALSAISKAYRVDPEGGLATSDDLPRITPAAPVAPAAPTPVPVAASARRAQASLEPVPTAGQRAVWALTLLLLGVLIATWILRLLALTPRPALIIDSTPPGAIVYVDDAELPGRTPIVVKRWPGEGTIEVRWIRRGYAPCTSQLTPNPDRTVHGQCVLRSTE